MDINSLMDQTLLLTSQNSPWKWLQKKLSWMHQMFFTYFFNLEVHADMQEKTKHL